MMNARRGGLGRLSCLIELARSMVEYEAGRIRVILSHGPVRHKCRRMGNSRSLPRMVPTDVPSLPENQGD